MPVRITCATAAEVHDFDEATLKAPELLDQLDGLALTADTVVPYLAEAGIQGCSGGYLRLIYDSAKCRLRLSIELGVGERLKPAELKRLKENLAGQISDGIGAGAFDELNERTGLSIEFPQYDRLQVVQDEGEPWRPAKASFDKRYKAIARWLQQRDKRASPPAKTTGKRAAKGAGKPSPKALFRMIDKEEKLPALQAELARIGGDLSSVGPRQFPFVNFRETKLLELLLDAGLPVDTVDQSGHHLLYLATCAPALALLLDRGADVNRRTEEVYRATVLMRMAHLGNLDCVQMLLERGADARLQDFFGQTAAQYATKRTNGRNAAEAKIVALLEKAAART